MNKILNENFYKGYINYLHHSLEIYKTKEKLLEAINKGFVARSSAYISVADFLIDLLEQYYCTDEIKVETILKDIVASNLRSIQVYNQYIENNRDLFTTDEFYNEAIKDGRLATACSYNSIVDYLQIMLLEEKNHVAKAVAEPNEMIL